VAGTKYSILMEITNETTNDCKVETVTIVDDFIRHQYVILGDPVISSAKCT